MENGIESNIQNDATTKTLDPILMERNQIKLPDLKSGTAAEL